MPTQPGMERLNQWSNQQSCDSTEVRSDNEIDEIGNIVQVILDLGSRSPKKQWEIAKFL